MLAARWGGGWLNKKPAIGWQSRGFWKSSEIFGYIRIFALAISSRDATGAVTARPNGPELAHLAYAARGGLIGCQIGVHGQLSDTKEHHVTGFVKSQDLNL